MAGHRRDIMVLLKEEFMHPGAIESAVKRLNNIIFTTETADQFCRTHELVVRNRITSNRNRLLKLVCQTDPGAFRFLICKN